MGGNRVRRRGRPFAGALGLFLVAGLALAAVQARGAPAPEQPEVVTSPAQLACLKATVMARPLPDHGCAPLSEAAPGEWPGGEVFRQALMLRLHRPEQARSGRGLVALAVEVMAAGHADWTPGPVTASWLTALAADADIQARFRVVPVASPPVVQGQSTAGGKDLTACVVAYYAHDWAMAAATCSALAYAGDPHANLAAAYIWLHAEPPRHAEARDHARIAAEAGIRSAQLLYAGQLLTGVGGPPDRAAGLAWLSAAAAQGLPAALAAPVAGLDMQGASGVIVSEAVLPSPIDEFLEQALALRASGAAEDALPLLTSHKAIADRLWDTPAVRARFQAQSEAAGPVTSGL